jgi:hypothetical protein
MGKISAAAPIVTAIAAAFCITGPARAAGDTIQTVFASYGYAAERADVKAAVVQFCDGKPSCKFLVKTEDLGKPDPSPGNDKGLMIAWKCGAVDHKEQFAEGRNVSIACN